VSVRFLLDTNVVSEPVRPIPNSGVLWRLKQYEGQIGIASVVWHELVFGWERLPTSRKKRVIEDYLFQVVRAKMPIMPYDQAAAEWQAKERARLEQRGQATPFADGQIAAIAKVNDLILVTANRSHFDSFEGLAVEDWRG
jgi:tRNA(fMet)-specific endonuclease VapC